MTITQAIISGVIQGITEFFPVSSSGHLVILHSFFGFQEPQLLFDVFLHVGTLVSIGIYFRNDITRLFTDRRTTALYIIIGSIPVILVGLTLRDQVERVFAMPKVVGLLLLCTGLWLFATQGALRRRHRLGIEPQPLNIWRSLAIGCAESVAILPGISRSGATIGAALMSGLGAEEAFRFSFLLSIPAVLGAVALKALDGGALPTAQEAVPFLCGGITATVIGIIVLKILAGLIRSSRIYIFGIYCMLVGIAFLSVR